MPRQSFNFVRRDEVAALGLRCRIAWAATVYELVLARYSSYFQNKFLQAEALEHAKRFARGEPAKVDVRTRLLHRMEDLLGVADNEGYGLSAVFPGMMLLTDMEKDSPQDSVVAVGDAACMFADHQFHRRGLSTSNRGISTQRMLEPQMPVYHLARSVYEEASRMAPAAPTTGVFPGFRLDDVNMTPPTGERPVRHLAAPPHEIRDRADADRDAL